MADKLDTRTFMDLGRQLCSNYLGRKTSIGRAHRNAMRHRRQENEDLPTRTETDLPRIAGVYQSPEQLKYPRANPNFTTS
jgi:hypothetical protein